MLCAPAKVENGGVALLMEKALPVHPSEDNSLPHEHYTSAGL